MQLASLAHAEAAAVKNLAASAKAEAALSQWTTSASGGQRSLAAVSEATPVKPYSDEETPWFRTMMDTYRWVHDAWYDVEGCIFALQLGSMVALLSTLRKYGCLTSGGNSTQ
jgi:hypothetical protein